MSAQAENPGKVKFSYKKYYSFRNRINTTFGGRFHADMCIDNVTRALFYGDTQPALVMSVAPLTVAAYSDEIDGNINGYRYNRSRDKISSAVFKKHRVFNR